MKFTGRLPQTVEIGGVEYPIRSDFRTSIEFELLSQTETNEQKLLLGLLQLYYGSHIPPDIKGAVERALWFYSGGDSPDKKTGRKKEPRVHSFDHDWDYIYAAFLEQFGVDLLEETNLHWWKFRAMFQSLSEHTKFAEIVSYRSINISKVPKERRSFYKKMKRLYALPVDENEERRIQDIRERLRNGESVESVFGNAGDED